MNITNTRAQSTMIYKYTLGIGSQSREMPKDATILHVDMQDGQIRMWVEVDPDASLERRFFQVVGTGWPIPPTKKKYLGTILYERFVWHIFEKNVL